MNENSIKKDLILREKLAIQRTHLANQATFLSFLRTSMYFLVAGFTIQKLSDHENVEYFEILLFVISALLLLIGVINYWINDKKIKKNAIHIGDYKLEYEHD